METVVNITPSVDFSEYSTKYDLLSQYSQPYQKLGVLLVKELLQRFDKEESFSFLDVGGGTGNFTRIILDHFPNAEGTLLDPSSDMLDYARLKMDNRRVTFIESGFEQFNSRKKYDLVLCVHALYLMPDPKKLIPKFGTHINRTGTILICDIGQQIKVVNWAVYLFLLNLKAYGLLKAISILREANEIVVANREIEKNQKCGKLWTHTLKEFKNMFGKYYKVESGLNTYRGCSNLLRCSLHR